MRELRFRAWRGGRMVWGSPDVIFSLSDVEDIMQWTGLYDKNVKEVWEGDIVRVPAGYQGDYWSKEHIDVIEWDVEDDGCDQGYFISLPDGGKWSQIEVIGNIHETPELLKGGQYVGQDQGTSE